MIHQTLQDDYQFGVVCCAKTADAGRDHMRGIGGEAADVSEGPDWAILIAHKHRFTRIFNYPQGYCQLNFVDR